MFIVRSTNERYNLIQSLSITLVMCFSAVEVPPPLPPANPSSAAARVDGKTKHLPRKFFPVDSDSDDDIGIIPPPPYNPAPPPPPAKLSNKPLPAPPVAPPTASKPTGPLSSSGVPPPPAPPPPRKCYEWNLAT